MLSLLSFSLSILFFFFNDTATTEIYTLSLHDALPILCAACAAHAAVGKKKDRRARPCLTKACRRPRWRDFPTAARLLRRPGGESCRSERIVAGGGVVGGSTRLGGGVGASPAPRVAAGPGFFPPHKAL